jgi:hypothetical protein
MRSLRVTVVIHVKKDVDTAPALSQAVQGGRRSATAVHFHEVALFEQEDGRIDHSFELRRQWVCKVQACPYGLSSSCSRGAPMRMVPSSTLEECFDVVVTFF